jgi:hypothetical protein
MREMLYFKYAQIKKLTLSDSTTRVWGQSRYFFCGVTGADLPIAAMVRDASAISLSQVTTKQPADHGESSTDDHIEHASCDSAGKVGKEEDNNSGIHQDC